MALSLSSLRPYTSITLARVGGSDGGPSLAADILADIRDVLDLGKDNGPRKAIGQGDPVKDGEVTVGYIHYEERRSPGWTKGQEFHDVLNHLALVCVRNRHVGILLTDPGRARAIAHQFKGSGKGLAALAAIDTGTLNAAFAEGPARTLWLSGIHTRTTVKADSKVLSGEDLRDALDPIGDQTYYFTAARCVSEVGSRRVSVGVAPRRSRVWTGPSRSWDEFRDGVVGLLRNLEATEKAKLSEETPLPVLAARVTKATTVAKAFDLSVIVPELMAETVSDDEARALLERWAYEAKFSVTPAKGSDLSAEVLLGTERLGTLDVRVDISDLDHVTYEITPRPATGYTDALQEVVDLCNEGAWLQVRYESGHTLSEGSIYLTRFRDVEFANWRFADFTGYDIRKEKPTVASGERNVFAPGKIGKQDSLFCWVYRTWMNPGAKKRPKGWLACDDGSMEMADFILFDTGAAPPVLWLIHVKGSKSSKATRSISVSDYEVVTGQAVKNLRNLDNAILREGLGNGVGKEIGNLVLRDGAKRSSRKEMMAALDAAGASYTRRVVVLQPQVSSRELVAARQEKERGGRKSSGRVTRLLQLESLLVGVESNCRALQADFQVIADGTPVPAGGPKGGSGRRPR